MVVRLVVLLLTISLVTIGGAHFIGTVLETTIWVDYYKYHDESYYLFILDTSRDFRFWLGGTRCFKQLLSAVNADFYKSRESGRLAGDTEHSFEYDIYRDTYRDATFISVLGCR